MAPFKAEVLSKSADYTNDASKALSDLSIATRLWFLRSATTGQPYLGGLIDTQDKALLARYTTRRDQYRRAAGEMDRWTDNTIPLRRVSPQTPQLNCRILFDKHVHGENVKK